VKFLVDMNLSPFWVPFLQAARFEAVHWSSLGDPAAKDAEIMDWARRNDLVVFTHDLDFGALLANTRNAKPSVLQVRTQDVTPVVLGPKVIAAARQFENDLIRGALVTVDENRSRARILPL
jgi:predicted nuclease of predicted toxin-antitoxin system